MIEIIDFFPDKLLSNWVFLYFIYYYISKKGFNPIYLFFFIIFVYYLFVFLILLDGRIFSGLLYGSVGIFSKLLPTYLIWTNTRKPYYDIQMSILFFIIYYLWLLVNDTNIREIYQRIITEVETTPLTIENIPKIVTIALGVEIEYK